MSILTKSWSRALFRVLALPTFLGLRPAQADIFINELMAANDSVLQDNAGDFDDWIELYNSGLADVDLAGFYISDSIGNPLEFQLPAGSPLQTTVPAGGYLILWADNQPEQGANHLPLALSASGEELILTAPDGITIIDQLVFGSQTTDFSTGRFPDGSSDVQIFTTPTPGASNQSGFTDQVADTSFSVDRGFFDQPFQVEVSSATLDAEIHYTLDGSTPNQSSPLYSGALDISQTTTLRVRAFKDGYLPTNTDTQTYIFVSDVIQQSPNGQAPGPNWPPPNYNSNAGQIMDYGMDPNIVNDPAYSDLMDDALLSIPTMSMVTDSGNLFNPTTGIYAVPSGEGPEWERPTSLELIYPDGTEGFQIDCGMRLRGSSSANTNNPKHAFRFFFRSEYGDSKLNYPLFGDEGVDEFDKVDLRTTQNFSWARDLTTALGGTMNREVLWRDTQKAMEQPYTRSRYYHLYINGQYWGIFQTQERAEANYAESYLGGNEEDFDVIKSNASGPHITGSTDGNEDAWTRLWQACLLGFNSNQSYYNIQGYNTNGERDQAFERLVDLDNLIDYMIIVFYSGSIDGPLGKWSDDTLVNNYYAIYNRENPDGFKHFVHDFETSMMNVFENRIGPFGAGDLYPNMSAQYLHERMADHPEYRMQFADRIHEHLFNDGALTTQAVLNRFNSRASEIELAIIAESARWGDALKEPASTRDETWNSSLNQLRTSFFPVRPNIVLGQLRAAGFYPDVDAPEFLINGERIHGGVVVNGDQLTFENPNGGGTVYYTLTGQDVRTPFNATQGGSVDLVSEANSKTLLIPNGPVSNNWFLSSGFDDSAWDQASGVIGYEVSTGYENVIDTDIQSTMYFQNSSCLIRIPFTVTSETLAVLETLSLNIRYDDGFVAYLNGTQIHREAFVGTPAWNSQANGGRPDSITPVSFDLASSVGLLNEGENLLAIHGLNAGINSSDFLIGASLLATLAQTAGAGGELTPDAIAYSSPVTITETTQVQSRVLENGTWSAITEAVFVVAEPADSIRISELMYSPAGNPDAEYLELVNVGSEPITLTGFQFTDGIDLIFPNSVLAPNERGVVVADLAAFQSVYGNQVPVIATYTGRLNNMGEQLILLDAIGNTIFDFTYDSTRLWPVAADGFGHAMVPIQENLAPELLNYPNHWKAGAVIGGTPTEPEPSTVPLLINEIVAHTDTNIPGRESNDLIEIYNPNPFALNLGDYYLSDDGAVLDKWRMPQESLAAGGIRLFSEETGFNTPLGSGFSLSKLGEDLFLSHLPSGGPNRIVDAIRFEASENGDSLSRIPDGSPWLAKTAPSPDQSNPGRRNDVLISEIMYRPTGLNSEYLEIWNPTTAPVLLDTASGPWFINGGIDFAFPSSTIIAAGEHLVIVPFDPTDSVALTTFESIYGSMENVRLFGPYTGSLSNGGELVSLIRFQPPDPLEPVSDVIVDEVYYFDRTPFPESADGSGLSLHRFNIVESGNNPAIWSASEPSPGVQSIFNLTDLWLITENP